MELLALQVWRHELVGFENLLSVRRRGADAFLDQLLTQDAPRLVAPVEIGELLARKTHERVAAADGVVEKGKRMVTCQRGQPQRKLGEIDGHRVAIDAVETALRHQPARVQHLVFVGRNQRHFAMVVPRIHQLVTELAAGLDEERRGADGEVADVEIEQEVLGE